MTSEKAAFYITWKWEYLRRNASFIEFINSETEKIRKLWGQHLENISEELPDDVGCSYRREVHEVNGRQEVKDKILLTLRRVFDSPPVWLEVSEQGEVLCGLYLCGRRFHCDDVSVESYGDSSKRILPKELSVHAVSDSVVVKDYPKGNEFETLVTVKLSRPIEEIICDIRHLQTLWNPSAPGNSLESLVARHLSATPEVSFRDPGLKRAIGLFLLDFSKKLGGGHGSGARAVREAEKRGYIELLDRTPSNTTLNFWRERAEACINAAEVLSYSHKSN